MTDRIVWQKPNQHCKAIILQLKKKKKKKKNLVNLQSLSKTLLTLLPHTAFFPDLNKNYSFPGGSDSKESTCNEGDLGSIPGLGRFHGGGHDNLFQFSCLENPHGQRSLVGHSAWGCKELDMTG